jgi:hypothetical protein
MLAYVLQAPLSLELVVTKVSNDKSTHELYHRVSCFLHFFCPPSSERCFKILRRKGLKNLAIVFQVSLVQIFCCYFYAPGNPQESLGLEKMPNSGF